MTPTPSKRSIAAKARVAKHPKGHMSLIAKKRHAKKTPEERSLYGKMMRASRKTV